MWAQVCECQIEVLLLRIARVSCRKRWQTVCPPPSRMSERCSVNPGVAYGISSERINPYSFFFYRHAYVCIHPQICTHIHIYIPVSTDARTYRQGLGNLCIAAPKVTHAPRGESSVAIVQSVLWLSEYDQGAPVRTWGSEWSRVRGSLATHPLAAENLHGTELVSRTWGQWWFRLAWATPTSAKCSGCCVKYVRLWRLCAVYSFSFSHLRESKFNSVKATRTLDAFCSWFSPKLGWGKLFTHFLLKLWQRRFWLRMEHSCYVAFNRHWQLAF